MSSPDPTLFARLKKTTADFKKDIKEQRSVLDKLKDVGKTLADLSGEADPITEVIDDTLSAIDAMDTVVGKLDRLKIPGQ